MTTTSSSSSIPLNKLVPWSGNVRKTTSDAALGELAASIAAHGLLQSLVVRKDKRGKYAVVAGRRRLLALMALAEAGTINADMLIPCHVIADEADATEISLVENVVREPMHPADECEAFLALTESGMAIADIAARFGVTETVVLKRLKLARVSPVIIDAYRAGELTLAQVQAFASTDDHAAQKQVFDNLSGENDDPEDIRYALTPETDIPATDKRVRFVTVDAYEQAGGKTRRDLFAEGDFGIFILDAELLDALVAKKLAELETKIRAEGRQWVEIDPDLSWETRNDCGRIWQKPVPLAPELQTEYEALESELDNIYDGDEDMTDEQSVRIQQINDRIREIDDRESIYRPEEVSVAGVFITLDRQGKPEILRGYVRPDAVPKLKALRKAMESGNSGAVNAVGGDATAPEPEKSASLPASLIESLTGHRSAALAASLAGNPDIALAAVVHAMVRSIFYTAFRPGTCLEVSAKAQSLKRITGTTLHDDIERALSSWRDRLPGNAEHLWQWCLDQRRDTLLSLLAFCAGMSVNAVQAKIDRPDCGRLLHAHQLAEALKLDMSVHFTPDAGNYFGKISKDRILADIKDATGREAAPASFKLKKKELASLAAREIGGTGWLPTVLRRTGDTDEGERLAA